MENNFSTSERQREVLLTSCLPRSTYGIALGHVFNVWKQPIHINPKGRLQIIYARPSTLESISFHKMS